MAARTLNLSRMALASVGVLAVECVLGIANTLYVDISPRDPWGGSHPLAILYLHVLIGIALLINAIMMVNASLEQPETHSLGPTVIGVLGIVVAIGAGVGFVNGGGRSNLLSALMGVGFLISLVAYIVLWVQLRRTRPAARQ
jgi:heme A synthase